jgi:hypothetical protein
MAVKTTALGWPEEAALAEAASRVLAAHLRMPSRSSCAWRTALRSRCRRPALRLLVHMLEELGRGSAVAVIPVQRELTTQLLHGRLHLSVVGFAAVARSFDADSAVLGR